MSEHQPHEFLRDRHAFLRNQPPPADDCIEIASHQQAPAFHNFHGSFNHFTLPSSPYENFDNTSTLFTYQHASQPVNLDSQYQMHPYTGAQTSNIHTPTSFLTSAAPGQPWMDEVHSSYAPVVGENLDWTPPEAPSHGWQVDTPFTTYSEQFTYANTPTVLPISQNDSLEGTISEGELVQSFVSNITPRPPMQQAFSKPLSIAHMFKNEQFKKDIETLLFENSGHNGHKPMRISKTKKANKTGQADNQAKQEACWRCKRYRKAVSCLPSMHNNVLNGKVHW
jgi:hypothetical protein